MSNTEIRGAASITDEEFLVAYNNSEISNSQMLEQLQTDWTAIGVKLRSEHLRLHRTGERTGGAKGTYTGFTASQLAPEAKIWKATGVIQPKPPRGQSYTPMTAAQYRAATEVNAPAAPATPAPATPAPVPAPAAPVPVPATPATTFSFRAEIFGTAFSFSGEDKDSAFDALFQKLRELNFSKVSITNASNGRNVGIGEIANGGSYKLTKQLTAACALCYPRGTVFRDGVVVIGATN